MTDTPKRFTELLDWDEDDRATQAETYAALRRSIARTAGFGLKFFGVCAVDRDGDDRAVTGGFAGQNDRGVGVGGGDREVI
ncbi:MAG: hypothetical protein HC795_15645 [Coleofasciculaceae cyanobacterium RL_1_1]|nr:hypothetical protein [Coleofasciculaceae cyanobacterium RL_1_1]